MTSSTTDYHRIDPKPTATNAAMPVLNPVVKPSRMARALVRMNPPFIQTKKGGVVPYWRIDWRALERNKYAPWGVGHAAKPQ